MSRIAQEAILIEKINAANPTATPWTQGQLVFGAITATEGEHNSSVSVSADGYAGTVDVHYNRVNVNELETEGVYALEITDQTRVYDLIEELATFYNLTTLSTADFVDGDLPEILPGATLQVPLNIAATSLAWYGSINVSLSRAQTPLSEVLVNNVLNGLVLDDLR